MNVNILGNQKKNKIEISVVKGSYELASEGRFIRSLGKDTTFIVRAYQHQILTEKKNQKVFIKSFLLRVNSKDKESVFQIKSINGEPCDYRYKGDILITADGNSLNIINILDIDDYLVGVLRAEVGGLYDPEFLKSMAIISRTYTLRNLGKNIQDGFDLTDQVDCQVYMGMNYYEKKIVDAVKSTTNEVILDSLDHYIDALFHSNSGGKTSRASYAWSRDLDYCQEVEDSFSMCGKHYRWTIEIPKNEWYKFLLTRYDTVPKIEYIEDTIMERKKYLVPEDSVFMMRDLRSYFKLKSSLFNIYEKDYLIVFEGRGYGHGVGMSQEGAYEMSLQGHSYEDIILFYYQNVKIGCMVDSVNQIKTNLAPMNQAVE